MARRFAGSRFPRGAGSRRKVTWSSGPEGLVDISATGSFVFPTGAAAVLNDMTIVRTRGELLLTLSSASGAQLGFQYAAGICVVSENAAGVGATAIPAPLTDSFWDGWLWHREGNIQADATATLVNQLGCSVDRIQMDSKAMRKIHLTDVMVGVIEVIETGTCILRARMVTRVLTKLA